ncbi:syntaxin-8 [Onthophagus taurus]|uniref:syntaxin-8 n=1 Tax=Onthophagus taurus TaxID=166361 RepID=UPI000C20B445|nr:uncharacterized protein LOC111420702 [Onthophagus taurus]
MALLNLGDDPWLLEYESCEKLRRDIMEQLSLRQTLTKSSDKFASLSANIRIRLKQFNNEVNELRGKLEVIDLKTITFSEKERRNRNVELLASEYIKMQKVFDDDNRSFNRDRINLLGASTWGSDDEQLLGASSTEKTVGELKTDQKTMLEEQNKGLENLSNILARQKNIANTISTEVDLHHDIIEDLGSHIDRTDVRLGTETRNVAAVDRKDNTCVYWVVIVLLFISIVTVVCI